MWDRLLVDCNIATLEGEPGARRNRERRDRQSPTGSRPRRQADRACRLSREEVDALDGAWVTPGLVDCHTHLLFGGTRADEHAMRRAGATYEEIAKAGGGIASTVQADAAASDEELLEQSRRRLHALMQRGCTTIEIKSGYGLDPKSELRLLRIAASLARAKRCAIVPTLLALHALPADQRDRRAHYVGEIVDKLIPAAAKQGLATSVDAFCDTSPSRRKKSSACSRPLPTTACAVRLHAEQLSNQNGAALAAHYRALSADHLEHLDEAGAKAMAAAGTVAVLLPGAFYALQETRSRRSSCCASTRCRSPSRPTATPGPRRCCRRLWR